MIGLLISAATFLFAQVRQTNESGVSDAPKIGSVKAFNADFGFVIVAITSGDQLVPGKRLGIRRKGELVIIAIVETTEGNTATCGLLGYIPPTEPNSNAPRIGDDIIFYPPKVGN